MILDPKVDMRRLHGGSESKVNMSTTELVAIIEHHLA